ncbi:hypothetical protein D9758_008372 [Tetrapyrgos nigripes]|uniref:Uncharacterized protein n=1 Tax=Tetrapyrgos nigripes TaxID=182062 RepID=A0A8H5GEC1_9AGAR|nr:hypothetical protein D9758_008372 [Tetrapyrgos nigripes]
MDSISTASTDLKTSKHAYAAQHEKIDLSKLPQMMDMTASSITEQVIAVNNANCPDERTKFIFQHLVQHLHDFIRSTQITTQEWLTAVNFLTEAGYKSSLLSDILGVTALVDSMNNAKPPGATETAMLGPAFVEDANEFANGDSIASEGKGDYMYVHGRITDTKVLVRYTRPRIRTGSSRSLYGTGRLISIFFIRICADQAQIYPSGLDFHLASTTSCTRMTKTWRKGLKFKEKSLPGLDRPVYRTNPYTVPTRMTAVKEKYGVVFPYGSRITVWILVRCEVLTKGNPIPDAVIDTWETDGFGLYDNEYEVEVRGEPDCRGRLRSDGEGKYAFRAVVPVSYPIPTDGPVRQIFEHLGRHPFRPAHLHLQVEAPGYEKLTTQLYMKGDRYLTSDAVFSVKSSLIVDLKPINDPELSAKRGFKDPHKVHMELKRDIVLTTPEEGAVARKMLHVANNDE